VQLSILNW